MAQTEGDLYERLSDETLRFALELVNPRDVNVAVDAMRAAARAMEKIRHPDEPEDAFVNYISRVYETEEGAWFYVDVKDHYAFPDECSALLRGAIEALDTPELSDAVLKWTDRQPPPVESSLPKETRITLPPGFALPQGARVWRTRLSAKPSTWSWAMWQMQGDGDLEPLVEEYREELVRAGWDLGEIEPGSLDDGLSFVRWTVANETASGKVVMGSVSDSDAYELKGQPLDEEERAWGLRFAAGHAWFAEIEFVPTESDWRPDF